jgi:hypothetical protein
MLTHTKTGINRSTQKRSAENGATSRPSRIYSISGSFRPHVVESQTKSEDGFMSQTVVETPVSPETQAFAILRFAPAIELTDDQFFALCRQNRDLRLERTAQGDLIVMPPTGFKPAATKLDNGTTLCLGKERRDGRRVRLLDRVQSAKWRRPLS